MCPAEMETTPDGLGGGLGRGMKWVLEDGVGLMVRGAKCYIGIFILPIRYKN